MQLGSARPCPRLVLLNGVPGCRRAEVLRDRELSVRSELSCHRPFCLHCPRAARYYCWHSARCALPVRPRWLRLPGYSRLQSAAVYGLVYTNLLHRILVRTYSDVCLGL
jgi:hypothetical protein